MSASASEQLAQRYALQLSPAWQAWLDQDAHRGLLAGQFRAPIDIVDLVEKAPPDLWPGFMLPDTLPLVSNDYGDWWCVRVGPSNEITEVVQWLHGGGDWLPVGRSIAEAALWDTIHRWHDQAVLTQPAAHEYPVRSQPAQLDQARLGELESWLSASLGAGEQELRPLLSASERGQYRRALETLLEHDWSASAAACELIEVALQGSLALLAEPKLAKRCGINWTPEYISWLFDTHQISDQARQLLRELSPDIQFDQDWNAAGHWAEQTRRRRSDLSWAGDIAGWSAERSGDLTAAVERYFANRHASAFSDQSVRLRSHWFPERYGKFCSAQLARLREFMSPEQQSDLYLQILWHEPPQRTRAAVREYWLELAGGAMARHDYAQAYDFYTGAGWDLGAERLSDYVEILDGLALAAERAGWAARALVAATHGECLRSRLPPSVIQ